MSQGTEKEFVSSFEKHFDFKTREELLYRRWEEAGIFRPEAAQDKKAPVFNIAMPPPNANGELHLGHAFGYTVMDILGRYNRLRGKRVLLTPGKDHAGIQTQVVFEKKLQTEKVDYKSISRDKLFDQCYDFCIDRAHYMRAQEKRLGISADWSREMFTLDPKLTDVVYETFERMWRDGLIYRGKRIINWSVFSQTALSDVEVEYKEQEGGLWYICYALASGPQPSEHQITLPSGTKMTLGSPGLYTATTRPETMLGDTALAVNPEDERYKSFIGKEVIVPLVGRRIKVVADSRVDISYGTGVVKVTPAHDFTDYDIGQDHNLEIIQVIGKDGRMTEAAGADFRGMTSSAARETVINKLQEAGLLLDTTKIVHKVPIGERGKDVIEPLISEQWFVAVDKPGNSLKEQALKFVRDGRITIFPSRFQVLVEQWLENLRDWCISRQIWWGHRLPVWYHGTIGSEKIHVGRTPPEATGWVQDTDTFDTWFSSGQWAYSTAAAQGLLNLDQGQNQSDFFPTHTMVMGRDILFFWACRMLLMTTYRLNNIPWQHIFFTGLIRDERGQKMSKSRGNGIEPNEIIERFGTDALRLSLVMGAAPGNDIIVSERKIEGYSKFVNKLWNASKLIEMKVGALPPLPANYVPQLTLDANRWLMSELAGVASVVTQRFDNYEISIAADELYNFTWSVFCDWYLEMMKVLIDSGTEEQKKEVHYTVTTAFRSILTMLHPFIPFITEEIYQKLSFHAGNDFLATAQWTIPEAAPKVSTAIPGVIETVSAIRSVKSALNIAHKRIRVATDLTLTPEATTLVKELARVDFCELSSIPPTLALKKPFSLGWVVCEVEGKENYRKRLEKDALQSRTIIGDLEKKLSGAFASQGKPDVVEKERERLTQTKQALVSLEQELAVLGE